MSHVSWNLLLLNLSRFALWHNVSAPSGILHQGCCNAAPIYFKDRRDALTNKVHIFMWLLLSLFKAQISLTLDKYG